MPERLLQDLDAYIRRHALLGEGAQADDALADDALAVAVSGGLDSLTLLHALHALGHRPLVVSFDHGLRPESRAEVERVRGEAERLGLPFKAVALALEPGAALAARARAARYAALDALPQPRVALGHHLDDQAETVLDRLARGAGARGLAGMAPRRGRYIRPLLFAPRARLEAWASARGLSWVTDPSNHAGVRGRLRDEVLPALEALRQGASANLARAARLLAADDALLYALAEPLLAPDGVRLAALRDAPGPLQRRAVMRLAERSGAPTPTAAQLDAALALGEPGRAVDVAGGWRLVLDSERLRCLPAIPGPRELTQGRWGIWELEASAPVQVRPPKAGERLAGQRLAERLRAAGVPASLRAYHPVIELNGRRWVPGVGPAPQPSGHASAQVRCQRMHGPAIPGGGPYLVQL